MIQTLIYHVRAAMLDGLDVALVSDSRSQPGTAASGN